MLAWLSCIKDTLKCHLVQVKITAAVIRKCAREQGCEWLATAIAKPSNLTYMLMASTVNLHIPHMRWHLAVQCHTCVDLAVQAVSPMC